ncbi:hypothetical protein MZE11_19525 [Bacillus amyloliquefaciens]|nr:hypothetical protein [Bacillus amyloliquefaciens]MCQ9140758.1 hypothetical protein [Bacillus amyloliquefaciens]
MAVVVEQKQELEQKVEHELEHCSVEAPLFAEAQVVDLQIVLVEAFLIFL